MLCSTPRLVVAGLAGDGGKTLIALGLARAFSARGLRVAPFKKGPDYIDAAWLACAARGTARNLDTFLMPPEAIGDAVGRETPADLMLIEGNRGLFDGLEAAGTHSTAELAKLLAAPVLLVVDVTKTTRTAAALVGGCAAFDPRVNLAGVVLNRVGTARQERVIRDAIRSSGGPPVFGAIPRLAGDPLPGRHLGLLTAAEHPGREEAIERAAQAIESHGDMDALFAVAAAAPATVLPGSAPRPCSSPAVRIGVFRDEAFSFYYPENLEALASAGATLVDVSPLADRTLPDVDALYLGGGFPEVHAGRLAANQLLREAVRDAARGGMPMYAECGGLMYLARELIVEGASHSMAGVFDLVVRQSPKPEGHGYVTAVVEGSNPWFERGTRLRGHEFHYSLPVGGLDASAAVLRLERGRGVGSGRDGLSKGRVWASYVHLHALGIPSWAVSFTALARAYREEARRPGPRLVPSPGRERAWA